MADKLLIGISAPAVTAAHWRGGKIAECLTFAHDEGGQADFKEYLDRLPDLPTHIMVDAVEEDYRFETLPHAFGSDRADMVSRKLRQHYRNTPYMAATPLGRDYPIQAVLFTACIGIVSAGRFWLSHRFADLYSKHPQRWLSLFRAGTWLGGGLWGVFAALALVAYGFAGPSALILIATAGMAAAGVSSLASDRALIQGFVPLVLGPTVVTRPTRPSGRRRGRVPRRTGPGSTCSARATRCRRSSRRRPRSSRTRGASPR